MSHWSEARELAKKGWHVRREAWAAGLWLVYQRGVAWFWDGATWRVVEAEDFAREEWAADDWTHIPPELAECKDDDGGGGGGGGNPPVLPPDDGGGGGGGKRPDPPDPPKPIPPTPTPDPGCIAPTLTGASALVSCVGEDKEISIEVGLSGGSGYWSVKANILGRTVSMGLHTAPGTASGAGPITCTEGQPLTFAIIATGWGACSPQTVKTMVTADCVCDAVYFRGFVDSNTLYRVATMYDVDDCESASGVVIYKSLLDGTCKVTSATGTYSGLLDSVISIASVPAFPVIASNTMSHIYGVESCGNSDGTKVRLVLSDYVGTLSTPPP